MICRRSPGRPSAAYRALQSRSLSGFDSDYATLLGIAPPLNDASTAHGGEAASTLTLLPKQRGREQTGCCQLLRLGSFLRGLETNLGSRSPVTGPCRNHASPQSQRTGARGLYSASQKGPTTHDASGTRLATVTRPTRPPCDGARRGSGRRTLQMRSESASERVSAQGRRSGPASAQGPGVRRPPAPGR